LIAALLFALHGVVDVSAHRVGTALAALLLLGSRCGALWNCLARLPFHRVSPDRSHSARRGRRWVFATRFEKPLPGAVGVENECGWRLSPIAAGILPKHSTHDPRPRLGTAALANLFPSRPRRSWRARQVAPALDDFRRARFLEPNVYEVPFEEGNAWVSAGQQNLALTPGGKRCGALARNGRKCTDACLRLRGSRVRSCTRASRSWA